MSFLKSWFDNRKLKEEEKPIRTIEDFWNWFTKHEQEFFDSISRKEHPEKTLTAILDHLQTVNKNIFALLGMSDKVTAELVLTADGEIKSVVFI